MELFCYTLFLVSDSFGKSKHRLFYFVRFEMSQVLEFYDSFASETSDSSEEDEPVVKRKI
jgi:hypothetical protein